MNEKSAIADVYAGDTGLRNVADANGASRFCFTVEAESEPGTFARIVNVLTIANIAPHRVTMYRGCDASKLQISIELAVALSTAQSIQRKLTQLTDVTAVEMELVA
jgi:acetolactate synthase regulatory subunit